MQDTLGKDGPGQSEPDFRQILPGISAGAVNGILTVMLQISFAAMIFSGELSQHFSRGIGLTLFGGFVFGVVLALTSSIRGVVSIAQDAPCAILALAATAVASGLPASTTSSEIYITVIAVIAVSSILTGIVFYLLGRFRLGNLVRFIPYPVVGGFLAGIGWLLLKGGIGVMTDLTLSLSSLPKLLDAGMLVKWIPGLILAAFLLFVSRRFSHFLVMPATIIGAVALFYLGLAVAGIPVTAASSRGWLLGPFPEGALWKPLSPSLLAPLDWGLVLSQAGHMGTIVLLSIISLLLNASGLELILRRDVDLNRELKTSGMANVLAGLGGSPAGYPALSLSALGHKLGSNSRLIGLTSGAMCGLALFVGSGPLSYLPRCLAGALLAFVGVDLLLEWLYRGWKRLPHADYTMVAFILVFIGVFGYLEGVAAGIVMAIVIFIVRYSRVDVVRVALSGRTFRSHVARAVPLRWILRKRGDAIQVLSLQGFLFFGTANRLFERVQARVRETVLPALRFLVFDFTHVTGMDSSALNSFVRMEQLAEGRRFILVLTSLSQELAVSFDREGLVYGDNPRVRVFPDLDRAMEWCENGLLESETVSMKKGGFPARLSHEEILESAYDETMARLMLQEDLESLIHRLADFVEVLHLEKDMVLLQQGGPPVGLYFIETGEVTAWLEHEDGTKVRLRTCGMGSVVGELSLYTDSAATATIVVNRPTVAYHLSKEAFDRLEEKVPDLAARLHRAIARLIAERLADATAAMQSMR
jgi:SulP family sulfate permease